MAEWPGPAEAGGAAAAVVISPPGPGDESSAASRGLRKPACAGHPTCASSAFSHRCPWRDVLPRVKISAGCLCDAVGPQARYQDLGEDYYATRHTTQRRQRTLIRDLERLTGQRATLQPHAA